MGRGRAAGLIAAAVVVLLIGGITVALAEASRPTVIVLPAVTRVAEPPPGSPVEGPVGTPLPAAGPRPDPLTGWAERLAGPTGIPAVALRAYARAQLELSGSDPGCHLSWPTLAGIGSVESDHGRYRGAALQPDGHSTVPIVGVPLDGSPGVRADPDSDGGRLDGDPRWDRAVGPLQFIPRTWRRWAADGDGDGRRDPYDLDDAALAAARYLCAPGLDLRTGPGWSEAIGTYNTGADYLRRVHGAASAYAARSLTAP